MYGLPHDQWKEISLNKRLIAQASRCLPDGPRLKFFGLPSGVVSVANAGSTVEALERRGEEGLYRVPRGWVWARGALLDAQTRIVDEISPGVNRPPAWWVVRQQVFFPRIVDCPGMIFSMIGDGSNNLYHWTFDLLPHLRMLDPARRGQVRVLVRLQHSFHRASLEAAGFPPASIISAEPRTLYRTEELLAASIVKGVTPDNVACVREIYLKAAGTLPAAETPVRLYISRAKASSRKIVNEAEIEEGLRRRCFQIAFFEELSLAEQVALVSQAEIIVSAHGAAWTLAVVARSGTPVIEILPAELEREAPSSYYMYRNLSRKAGLNYRAHHGEAVLHKSGPQRAHQSDIRVSAAQLLGEIDDCLKG
ncbi:MAG: glycosyltransferase family 61 protein [Methylacidiphilales bacterium]|nr:glycosyltransferase family 61 protein [Candidatus Methylacidiphilales bacterium]